MYFAFDAMTLALDAQAVVAARAVGLATGTTSAREARLMVSEKVDALFRAQGAAATAVLSGRPEAAPAAALAVYGRSVKANRRRLARGF